MSIASDEVYDCLVLLSDRCLSCLMTVCLPVTLVYCGQTVGWIKMKLGHIALDGDPAPLPPKESQPPNFRPMCYGQTAGWIKIPLGTEVGLAPGDIVRWEPCSPKGGGGAEQPPLFSPCIGAKRLDGSRCHLVRR